jgi:hypothetical protein
VVPVLSRMHTVPGSDKEKEVQERVRGYLNEMGPTAEETLSIASKDEIVVLHNDEEVYRTGRVVMGDALAGSRSPSSLQSDYFEAGQRYFVEPEEQADVGARILALEQTGQEPLLARKRVIRWVKRLSGG